MPQDLAVPSTEQVPLSEVSLELAVLPLLSDRGHTRGAEARPRRPGRACQWTTLAECVSQQRAGSSVTTMNDGLEDTSSVGALRFPGQS